MLRHAMLSSTILSLLALLPAAGEAKPEKVDHRKIDRDIQAHNAARMDNGGRIRLELLGKDVHKDRRTHPPHVVDGDVHSRQVITGVPYRFHIDLIDELPIEAIHFICSDYTSEQCPKDVVVKLSDGTEYRKELQRLPARRGKPKPRQTQAVGGKKARWVEVTILSNHPGGKMRNGKICGWGGIAEIEVVTSADLEPYLAVRGINPELPADVRAEAPRRDYSNVTVSLPKPIALGERPGIYMTAAGWEALFETMRKSPRGKPVLDGVIAMADGYLAKPVAFPDPGKPAQVKGRGDPPARAHDALAKQAGVCGYAYRISKDRKYADRVREILVGYAQRYPDDYKEHKGVNPHDTSKVMAQRLSEAMWLIPQIQAYDLTADSGAFSDADRELIEKDLILHAVTFINRKKSAAEVVAERDRHTPGWRTARAPQRKKKGALGNWTAFYNLAFIQAGSVLGDRDWIDIGAAGLKYMLENGIGEDGMWGEGAIGYQQFARHAMTGGLESLACKGIDLWSYKTNAFKNLFDSEFAYAYPDGTSPGINDSGRAAVGSGWTAMSFDYAFLRYGDRNYAATINDCQRQLHQSPACYFPTRVYRQLDEVPVEGYGSLVFDKLGYAILRGEGGGRETFLLMDYGPHGGTHGHYDKLNLILFADGDELAGEPPFFRYEDSRHPQWTKQSVAHWTVAVDEHSQKPTTGRLVCFADEGDVKVMRGQAAEAYAGVALDRTVVQLPGYVLDVFRAWGPAEHTFDYPLCFRGRLDAMSELDADSLKPMADNAPGYMHLHAAAPVAVKGAWTGTWSRDAAEPDPDAEDKPDRRGHPANDVRATVLPAEGQQVILANVPGDRQQALIRRVGTDQTFLAVIDPYKDADAVKSARRIETAGEVPADAVEVTRTDGGTDLIVVRHDPFPEGEPGPATTFGDRTTRALVTVIRLDKSGKETARIELGGKQ